MLSPRLRWKLHRYREQLRDTLTSLLRPQPKPRVCFSCGRLVGAAEKVCSHCGANQAAFSISVFKRLALAVIPAETPVTYALLFANLLFFAVAYMNSVQAGTMRGLFGGIDSEVLYRLGAKFGVAITHGHQYWRLVMPIFLHGGILHFGLTSFVLWQVGPQVEELFGSRRFLFLYLATGVAGFVASTWWYGPRGLSVGSSGAVFGLIGILISYISQSPGFASEYRASLIRWVIFILVIGIFLPIFFPFSFRFDNAAHIGGLLTGMALGRRVSVRRPATAAARLRLALMSWGSVVVIAWSVAMVLLNLPSANGS